jgi:NAD dependent epimerase/dehydratase family enzyme
MSTAHIYGDPPTAVCDETSAYGYRLAPTVGKACEDAFDASAPSTTRRAVLRTSFVLDRSGGALDKLVRLARFGLGGKVGSGKQGFSWIHELDMNRLFVRAIANDDMNGAYIATAPNPVSNAEFMRELRRALGVPFGMPAARWQVRLAAPLLLRTDPDFALYGRYCVSTRLRDENFEFAFPSISSALQNLFNSA